MGFYFEINKTTNPTVDFHQYLGKANFRDGRGAFFNEMAANEKVFLALTGSSRRN